MVEGKLSIVELFIHVRVWNIFIDEVKEDEVGDIDDEEEFENGISLLKDGCFFLFEAEKWLDDFHFW